MVTEDESADSHPIEFGLMNRRRPPSIDTGMLGKVKIGQHDMPRMVQQNVWRRRGFYISYFIHAVEWDVLSGLRSR
jgi:hypothetical protein